jgi:hypothetical protein
MMRILGNVTDTRNNDGMEKKVSSCERDKLDFKEKWQR